MNSGSFRSRVRAGERLLGSFVKTAAHPVVEIMAGAGFDFCVLDAEHAPFDRRDLDLCLLAARAASLPALVRLPDTRAETVLNTLDLGATGVLAPHMRNAAEVLQLQAACRYRDGARGYSNSPRAGGYGQRGMAELVEASDRDAAVLCQIEDREAVERIDEIAALDGIDCLFIGRADLAVSYAVFDTTSPVVDTAVQRICAAGRAHGRPVGVFLPDLRELARHEALGVTLFVIGSDQSMLRAHGLSLAAQFQR